MDKIKYLCVDKVAAAFYYYWLFFICDGNFVAAQNFIRLMIFPTYLHVIKVTNIFCILCTRIISHSLSGSSVSIANVIREIFSYYYIYIKCVKLEFVKFAYVWHIKFSHKNKRQVTGSFSNSNVTRTEKSSLLGLN